MKVDDFARSGFWGWYALARSDEKVGTDGRRRVRLVAPATEDRLVIEVSVAPDGNLRSVSTEVSTSWIRSETPASGSAVACISSLLRSLEPDDAFVWEVTAALLAKVGLGGPREILFDAPEGIGVEVVGDALLGRIEGLEVPLAEDRYLRTSLAPEAVAIEWLASPVAATTPRHQPVERPSDGSDADHDERGRGRESHMARPSERTLGQLAWGELTERAWHEVVEGGLPPEVAELCGELSRHRGRALRAFTMPMLEGVVKGLAVPFKDDDGIVFDRSLLGHPRDLAEAVTAALAQILYPGWGDLGAESLGEIEAFASIVAPALLSRLPCRLRDTEPLVQAAVSRIQNQRLC